MPKKKVLASDGISENFSKFENISTLDLSDIDNSNAPSQNDILVYNGSSYVPQPLSELSDSDWVDPQEIDSRNIVVEDREEVRRADIYMENGATLTVNYGGSVYVTDGICGCTSASSGSGEVVDDTTPQLGGNLDVNGNEIVSTSNQNITISPDGTGSLVVNSDIDMGTNSITDVKVGNWDASYSWGDHASEGYLKNVVEDITPQLGGDLVCDDGTASGSTSTNAAKSLLRTSSITFRTISGAAYKSGGQITQSGNASKIFLNPSFGNPNSSNSVVIGSIGSADTVVDNGKGTGISKVEAPSSKSLLFGANSFTNTSYVQVNSGEDALDTQSNTREGIELRLRESSAAIASVSIKSINLNATTGISATRSPKLKFYNPDDRYVSIQAPDDGNLPSNVGFILPNTVGSSNQVLKTDGATPIATLSWTDQSSGSMSTLADDTTPQLGGNLDLNSSDITGTGNIEIDGDISATSIKSTLEGAIHFYAQAAENILEGEVVYVSGISGNTPLVSKARADSSTTMPAFGIASENININNTGSIVTLGSQVGLDVSNFGETGIVFSLGDTLYVSSSESGKITNVSPSGESNLIQNIGKIERATPTDNITIKVGGAGRSNATPALDDGNIFIGDSNNRSVTSNLQTLVESYSINNVVEDTTPQLGGSLDVNGNSITSVSNGDVTISPNGTGSLVVNSDIDMGTNSITDVKVGNWDTAYGWGDHSLAGYATTDTNTFRTVVAGGSTLGATETLTLTAGTNVSIAEDAGTVTVSATDTNTQLSNEQVQDIVGAMVSGNIETNISVTYNDSTGKLNFSVSADITSVELTGDVGSISDSSGSVSFGINGGEGLETNASGSSISISVSQETEVIDIYDATDPGVNLSTIVQRYGFSDLTLIRSSGTNVRVQIRVDGHYEVGDTIYILNDLYDIEDTDITIEGVADSAFISSSKGTDFKTCFRSNYPGVALTGYNGQNIARIDFSSVSTSVTSSEAVLLGKGKRVKLVCIETDENGHSVFSVTKA